MKKAVTVQALAEAQAFAEAQNRARSLTVGTCFGGTVEISMRRSDGINTFTILQPVEAIELIHQLAAGVGCHINLQPRKDFSSWRDWRVSEEEKLHLAGHPPFVNDMAPHMKVGANLPPPEQQPGMKFTAKEQQNVMAIEKTVNRRSTKRAAKTP